MVHLREEVTAPTAAGGDASPVRKTKSDVTMTCIDHLDFYVLIVLSAWELVRNREGHVIQFRNNRSRISCNDLNIVTLESVFLDETEQIVEL